MGIVKWILKYQKPLKNIKSKSPINFEGEGIEISAIKKSEENNEIIIRAVETLGKTSKGKIYFNNVSGNFYDYRGWGKDPLEIPFKEGFSDLNGAMNFKVLEETTLSIGGLFQTDPNPFHSWRPVRWRCIS